MNFWLPAGGLHSVRMLRTIATRRHAVWVLDDLNDFYDPALKRRNIAELQALAKPFEFTQGDLTDAEAVNELLGSVRFDQIIHLAARAGVRPSLQEPALYQRVNVEGTVNLLEAARKSAAIKSPSRRRRPCMA